MPDNDFTPALEEAANARIAKAAAIKALREWMREPDYVERASLEWLMDWVNRRPIKELYQIERCR